MTEERVYAISEGIGHAGLGKLFGIDVLDAEGGQIRCTAFNDAAITFFEIVEVGKIYRISKGDIVEIKNLVRHSLGRLRSRLSSAEI